MTDNTTNLTPDEIERKRAEIEQSLKQLFEEIYALGLFWVDEGYDLGEFIAKVEAMTVQVAMRLVGDEKDIKRLLEPLSAAEVERRVVTGSTDPLLTRLKAELLKRREQ